MEDIYKNFAERYDLFYDNFNEFKPEVRNFYKKLLNDNKIKNILDCACGTGRDLVLFNSLGYDVMGCDISESMLEIAEKNLKRLKIKIPIKKADFRKLKDYFNRKFDAVMCLSSSIFHMKDEDEVKLAFKSMYDVLNKKGIVILTQGTTDKQWKEKPEFITAVDTENLTRLFIINYSEKGARYNVIDIFHKKNKYKLSVWSVDYKIIPLRDDLEGFLKESGFKTINFYGSYDFTPYDKKKSNVLIAVAHKT